MKWHSRPLLVIACGGILAACGPRRAEEYGVTDDTRAALVLTNTSPFTITSVRAIRFDTAASGVTDTVITEQVIRDDHEQRVYVLRPGRYRLVVGYHEADMTCRECALGGAADTFVVRAGEAVKGELRGGNPTPVTQYAPTTSANQYRPPWLSVESAEPMRELSDKERVTFIGLAVVLFVGVIAVISGIISERMRTR